MSDALPTPPASPSRIKSTSAPNPESSHADLAQHLDTLLERYLNLLDKQQNLQNELGKYMSFGFLSLARANQSCPPGRWYGRDYYDERMKAVRKIEIRPPEIEDTASDAEEEGKEDKKRGDDEKQQCQTESHRSRAPFFKTVTPSEPPTPDTGSRPLAVEKPDKESDNDASNEKPDSEDTITSASTPSTKTPKPKSTNPLRWFGVLIPPSLRAAQGSFTSAVEGPVPALVNVIAEMREVESQVNKLRGLLEAGKSEP